MATEDDYNINDLVDYKDFEESNLESNSDQDSFNKDIIKLYEDHKKKGGEKTTELQNSQRPVSKYQRNIISAGKRDEYNEDNLNSNLCNENTENNLPSQDSESNLEIIFGKFNAFLKIYKITLSDFMDNPKIYYNLDEFKENFKKLKIDFSNNDINFLFNYKNSCSSDGYLLGETFLNNFYKYIKWYEKEAITNPHREIKKLDSANLINNIENAQYDVHFKYDMNNKKLSKEEYIRINNEFKALNDEVSNILAKESRPKSTAKLAKIKKVASANSKNNNNISKTQTQELKIRPTTSFTNNNYSQNNFQTNKLKPVSALSHFRETMMKKKAEEEMVRLAIERRNKENQRDCIEKMTDANALGDELGIPKSYSAYADANDGKIICRVFDKETKKTSDLDLKHFLIEYKKLVKMRKVSLNI